MAEKIEDYIGLVYFLGRVLTDDYEIVLQKVGEKDSGIIAIANGHVTGRSVGAPMTDLAKKWVKEKAYLEHDHFINYTGKIGGSSDILIRASTYFLKNKKGELIGMFCINSNITAYTHLVNSLLKNGHIPLDLLDIPSNYNPLDIENLSDSMHALLDDIIHSNVASHKEKLSQSDRMSIVTDLYNGGVFQIKGAIPEVAKRLKMAESSVYRYIARIKDA